MYSLHSKLVDAAFFFFQNERTYTLKGKCVSRPNLTKAASTNLKRGISAASVMSSLSVGMGYSRINNGLSDPYL
jgi:hypothetical protein